MLYSAVLFRVKSSAFFSRSQLPVQGGVNPGVDQTDLIVRLPLIIVFSTAEVI